MVTSNAAIHAEKGDKGDTGAAGASIVTDGGVAVALALVSQKIDWYREESISQRKSISEEIRGVKDLFQSEIGGVAQQVIAHDLRIKKNAEDIAELKDSTNLDIGEVKVAHSRTTGFLIAVGMLATAVATFLGAMWSGIWVHH
jgi:hypothetical protein